MQGVTMPDGPQVGWWACYCYYLDLEMIKTEDELHKREAHQA